MSILLKFDVEIKKISFLIIRLNILCKMRHSCRLF